MTTHSFALFAIRCAAFAVGIYYVLKHRCHRYYFRSLLLGFRYDEKLPAVFRITAGTVEALHVSYPAGAEGRDRTHYEAFLDLFAGRFVASAGALVDKFFKRMRPGFLGYLRQKAAAPLGFDHVLKFKPVITLLSLVGGDLELIRTLQQEFARQITAAKLSWLDGVYLFFEATDRGLRPFGHVHVRFPNCYFDSTDGRWHFGIDGPPVELGKLNDIWHNAQIVALRQCGYTIRHDKNGRITSVKGLSLRAVALMAVTQFAHRQIAQFLLGFRGDDFNGSQRKIQRVAETISERVARGSYLRIFDKLFCKIAELQPIWVSELGGDLAANLFEVVRVACANRPADSLAPLPLPTKSWRDALQARGGVSRKDVRDSNLHRHAEADFEFAGLNNERLRVYADQNPDGARDLDNHLIAAAVAFEAYCRRVLSSEEAACADEHAAQSGFARAIIEDENDFNNLPDDPLTDVEAGSPIDLTTIPALSYEFVAFAVLHWEDRFPLRLLNVLPQCPFDMFSELPGGADFDDPIDLQRFGALLVIRIISEDVADAIVPKDFPDLSGDVPQPVNLTVIGFARNLPILGQAPREAFGYDGQYIADMLTALIPQAEQYRDVIDEIVYAEVTSYDPNAPEEVVELNLPYTNEYRTLESEKIRPSSSPLTLPLRPSSSAVNNTHAGKDQEATMPSGHEQEKNLPAQSMDKADDFAPLWVWPLPEPSRGGPDSPEI